MAANIATIHRTTGETSNRLKQGREEVITLMTLITQIPNVEGQLEWINTIRLRFNQAYKLAKKHIAHEQRSMKNYMNKRNEA